MGFDLVEGQSSSTSGGTMTQAEILAELGTSVVLSTRTINGQPLTADLNLSAPGGAAVIGKLFFCDDIIQDLTIDWHELEYSPDSGATGLHTSTATSTSGYVELDRYVTTALGHTELSGGEWTFGLWGRIAAGTSTPTGQFQVDLYKVAVDGSITTPFASITSAVFNNTAAAGALIQFTGYTAQQTGWLATDRIGVIVKAQRVTGNNVSVTFWHDTSSARVSYMTTPEVLQHNQIQGLNVGDYLHLSAAEKASVKETTTTVTVTTGNPATLNLALGRNFKLDLVTDGINSGESFSIALSNVPASGNFVAVSLVIITDSTLPTLSAVPTGGTVPTLLASKTHYYTLVTFDGGTTTRIFSAGEF